MAWLWLCGFHEYTEILYAPLCHTDTGKEGSLELCLYGIRELASATSSFIWIWDLEYSTQLKGDIKKSGLYGGSEEEDSIPYLVFLKQAQYFMRVGLSLTALERLNISLRLEPGSSGEEIIIDKGRTCLADCWLLVPYSIWNSEVYWVGYWFRPYVCQHTFHAIWTFWFYW